MSRVAIANTRSAGCTDGRLGLMLTELRLPSIKRLAADMCARTYSASPALRPTASAA